MRLPKEAKYHTCERVRIWEMLKSLLSSFIETIEHAEGGDCEQPHTERRDLMDMWRYLEIMPRYLGLQLGQSFL